MRIQNPKLDWQVDEQADGTFGSTGGPLITIDGLVVGMSESTPAAYPSFNMAVAAAPLKSWLEALLER